MGRLQVLLEQELLARLNSEDITEGQLAERVRQISEDARSNIAAVMLKILHKNAPKMLRTRRRALGAFTRRHNRRWGRPLDLLEMFHVVCEEIGGGYNTEHRPKAAKDRDLRFEAVVSLHAKAILVSNEILCLLQNGYADGALSRWRTLHELAVTALFLSAADQDTAERYLLSFHTQAFKAMRQYQSYSKRAKLDPFTPKQVRAIEEAQQRVVMRYGKQIASDYGWAAKALQKEKPSFHDIEVATGLDHWRPRYKWASQHTHSNFRPRSSLLGAAGAKQDILLVGPSNAGLTDPAHMAAISLLIATTALISMEPDLDYLVTMTLLETLEKQVGAAFLKTDQRLMAWHQKKLKGRAIGKRQAKLTK